MGSPKKKWEVFSKHSFASIQKSAKLNLRSHFKFQEEARGPGEGHVNFEDSRLEPKKKIPVPPSPPSAACFCFLCLVCLCLCPSLFLSLPSSWSVAVRPCVLWWVCLRATYYTRLVFLFTHSYLLLKMFSKVASSTLSRSLMSRSFTSTSASAAKVCTTRIIAVCVGRSHAHE